jgi:hypothetical protein
MHTAAGQNQKYVEETGEEFMQLIRPIWISGCKRNAKQPEMQVIQRFQAQGETQQVLWLDNLMRTGP